MYTQTSIQAGHALNLAHNPEQLYIQSMNVLKTVDALRCFVRDLRAENKTLSFVPTMGSLHEGHLELVRQGQKQTDICLPYIFLNPKQFGPNEDLDAYPRTLDSDLEKLENLGIDAVYVPDAAEIYPDGFATTVHVEGITQNFIGETRPAYFDGVCTVVCKMLLQCLPDIALFGEKDYQQLIVIQKMVTDLDIPVEIIGVPIVRDENGLALSSRNHYLDDTQYKIAVQLNKIMFEMVEKIKAGETITTTEQSAQNSLLDAGFDKIDYCAVVDAQTLERAETLSNKQARILIAVHLGKTLLIDNVAVE